MNNQISKSDEYKKIFEKDAELKNRSFKNTLIICNVVFAIVIVAFILIAYFKILPIIVCSFISVTLIVNIVQNIFDIKKSDRMTKDFIYDI